MAINDDWTYFGNGEGFFTVLAVNLEAGFAAAKATFADREEAEAWAATVPTKPGFGIAVEDTDGFVTWTSF